MGVINQLLTLFLWTFSFLGLFLADAALPLCDIPIDQLSRAQMPHPTTNQHLVVLFCYVFNLENKLNIWCSNQLYLTCLFLFRMCMNPPCLTLQAPFFAITTINQWQFLDDTMLKSSVTSPSGGCVEPWAPGRGVVTWQLFESVNSWGILTKKSWMDQGCDSSMLHMWIVKIKIQIIQLRLPFGYFT